MPRSFVAQVSIPEETFPRLKKWADANGYAIRGNAAKGTFRGTPSGIGGLLIGEISGAYAVSGNSVVQSTKGVGGQNQLAFGAFLRGAGLRDVS